MPYEFVVRGQEVLKPLWDCKQHRHHHHLRRCMQLHAIYDFSLLYTSFNIFTTSVIMHAGC